MACGQHPIGAVSPAIPADFIELLNWWWHGFIGNPAVREFTTQSTADRMAAKGGSVRGRILLALGLAAVLAAGGAIAAWALSAHGPAIAAARPVVVGRVLVSGRGVSGARVTLYAEPDQAVMASLTPGERVPQIVVGSAVSSGSGSYSISPTDWPALRRSATYGNINFEVIAIDGCRAWMYFFPRKLVQSSKGPALAVDDSSDPPQLAPEHVDLRLRGSARCVGGSS